MAGAFARSRSVLRSAALRASVMTVDPWLNINLPITSDEGNHGSTPRRVPPRKSFAVPPRRGDGARVQVGKGPKRKRARGSNVWTQSGEGGPLDELTEVVRTGDEVEETASGHDVTPRALRLGGGRG